VTYSFPGKKPPASLAQSGNQSASIRFQSTRNSRSKRQMEFHLELLPIPFINKFSCQIKLTWRNIPFRGEPHGERRPIISPVKLRQKLDSGTLQRKGAEQMMQTFSINHLACGVALTGTEISSASPSM
jgi:hypothetical protein